MQATLATPARFAGVGLHTGAPVRMTMHPAPAGHGVMFRRTDLGGALVPARWDAVVPSQLCTLLAGENDATVRTNSLADLENFGIKIDEEKNQNGSGPRIISTEDSATKVLVVPTNEELAIAQKSAAIAESL